MESIEAVVIGAGMIGLACARALARAGVETIILEQHSSIGSEISARNSEVIHAGIYYHPGSLKAKLCVDGRKLLYEFCQNYHVTHKKIGKLIVANSFDQDKNLEKILLRAQKNGVTDLQYLTYKEAIMLEPNLRCLSAIFSPSTGIISSHEYMLALLWDAESHGASLALKTEFISAKIKENHIEVCAGNEPITKLKTKFLVNAGGLYSTSIAHKIIGLSPNFIPKNYLAKGNYFSLSGRAPFKHLIYPVPEPGGLGIHLTLDLAGQARFGPDVEWIDKINYDVKLERSEKFYSAIRTYWPDLRDGVLQPAYSGIRPKIVGPGEADADFQIHDKTIHGIPGLVNLFGMESPGLTSSLAIADLVVDSLN